MSVKCNRMKVNDRVGIWFSIEQKLAKLYINGVLESEVRTIFIGKVFPQVDIFDNNLSVTITSGKLGFPRYLSLNKAI